MGRPYSILLCLCFLVVRGSHASVSPEDYWKNKLPTTPMPQSIKDSLLSSGTTSYDGLLSYAKDSTQKMPSGSDDAYGGLLSYGKHYAKKSLIPINEYGDGLLSYGKISDQDPSASSNGYDGLLSYEKGSAKDSLVETNGYDGLLSYTKESARDSLASTKGYDGLLSYSKDTTKSWFASTKGYDGMLSYAKDSLPSTNGYDGLLSYAKPSRKLLQYDGLLSYGPAPSPKSNTQGSPTGIMEDAVFFVESDLHHGKKMKLVLKKGTNKSFFLPRQVANKIPFSSNKLSQIYNILSMDPKSQEAYVLSRRIKLCEEPKVQGVEKKCVTSLESMVDFVTSKIGNNVQSLTTNLEKDHPKMEYTLQKVEKISKNDHETVVCHKMGYPYALFFCHGTATIRSYMVSLLGSDGTKIQAVAACHKETNDFLTNYMVNVLKVVPGSTRVCHFPGAEDNIIWVAN